MNRIPTQNSGPESALQLWMPWCLWHQGIYNCKADFFISSILKTSWWKKLVVALPYISMRSAGPDSLRTLFLPAVRYILQMVWTWIPCQVMMVRECKLCNPWVATKDLLRTMHGNSSSNQWWKVMIRDLWNYQGGRNLFWVLSFTFL